MAMLEAMAGKRELSRGEDARWLELTELVESLSPDQIEEPGYSTEGWSVKDLMAHIGSWCAEAVHALEQIRYGTYDATPHDVETLSQDFYEANRDMPMHLVRAECWSARTRMIMELNALPEVTPEAERWFVFSGPEHYEEHLPRLREWVRELQSR